ncbi:hypothetical protein [Streptomyces sp. NPDC051569]|uniref:hypothetical protein n=1 Tax=Streptomyces sp. NPDC051569 TaxID=3365661 RepID=UPI0037B5EA88
MRGDDAQWDAAGDDESRVRKGPRHAAPKKSLLTKLHIPAGKAMALAAMPTAVFVGMGLTPRLAMADDHQDIPFAPGPCVTRSDEPEASATPTPSGSQSPSPSNSPASPDSPSATPTPDPSESTAAPGSPGEPESSTAPEAEAPAAPKPTPTPTRTTKPRDPLGLGDLLGGLLGGGSGKEKPGTPAPGTSAPQAPAGTPHGDPTPKPPVSKPPATSPAGPAASPGDAVGGALEGTKNAIKDAANQVGATVEELDDNAKGLEAHADDDIPRGADGKEPFPCPTADPEALAAAKEEQGLPRLPDDPWKLQSSLLTLNGLDYHGIVEVKTGSGKIKKVLKFTASSLDIRDLHQTVVYPEGRTAHVKARAGSTSTIRDGQVTMYTEELKGNLFGLIPITFSPQTPPPVNVPFAFFTDVQVTQAGQFGGTLTIPGLQNYITD